MRGRVRVGVPMDTLLAQARELRRNPTEAETTLWWALRGRQLGVKFRRQRAIGRYIVDFVCLERRLVVEVDGGHHAEQVIADQARDAWLRREGFEVLRFSNREVLTQLPEVKAVI